MNSTTLASLLAAITLLALNHVPANPPQVRASAAQPRARGAFTIVDTGQNTCYDASQEIPCPPAGGPFYGQDAQIHGPQPAYLVNGDGTVSDLNTGLMWTRGDDAKVSWDAAVQGAANCRAGGHADWRLPTIKELYSLIQFNGIDPDLRAQSSTLRPFIDSEAFSFRYGRPEEGDRAIDAQYATTTRCVDPVMHGAQAMFGVNFADGRIKGYPTQARGRRPAKLYHVLYVRGNPDYGINDFVDNGDGTVTDRATGLMWTKGDSGTLGAGRGGNGGLDWPEALAWVAQLDHAGHTDWRLPNAKELQSIVDYTRSPNRTHSAAIDPVFDATPIVNEGGQLDFAYYWTSTTHARARSGSAAVYVAFGRALGYMPDRRPGGSPQLLDVHGAGAQRSDPKTGSPSAYPHGRGPQGDVVRIDNLVRAVRNATE